MRKVFAWLGVAALFMVMSRAEAANDVLKPYVVMILDTSGSMAEATGSGPTTCGKPDLKLNHAVCAINSIVNSYGEMVFALGRFRESTSGTGTAGSQVCDANGDQRGNASLTLPSASGGDVCNTQGPVCSDCDPATGLSKSCEENADCTAPDTCVAAAETGAECTDALDNDGDGRVNDGCPASGVSGEGNGFANDPDCQNNSNDDAGDDGLINDGCVAWGRCSDANGFGCKNSDNAFEVLTPLVDGNNAVAAEYTDGSCNACSMATAAGSINPEIWGVSARTFTPLSASMQGAQRYWEGAAVSTAGQIIWPATTDNMTNNPGFDPINRDPAAAVFLPTPGNTSCNPNPGSCTSTPGCVGAACCCATQCRPYITILLTDGAETCTTSANTIAAATDLAQITPRADAIAIASISRTGNTVTVTTEPLSSTGTVVLPHAFKVGDQIFIGGTGLPAQTGGTYTVTATPSSTQLQYQTLSSGTIATTSNTAGGVANSGTRIAFMSVRHTASFYSYTNQVKPIGFGIAPGDPQIEAIAHAGGAPDVPSVNEGYYAQDEADLQLAISQILADSVRAEICNERDDDCDTRVDEDFPTKGQACTNGQVGACVRSGTLVCSVNGLVCNAPAGTPTQEICNLIDDDCDGFIDETSERGAECLNNLPNDDVTDGVVNDGCPAGGPGNAPETGAQCTDSVDSDSDGLINDGCPSVGTCNVCVPTTEICDNADNDCDGVADKACRCTNGTNAGATCSTDGQAGGVCGTGGTCVCTPITRPCGVGVCGGIETCTGNNVWTGCTADTPDPEECDGDDDDCDGVCDGITLDCSVQNGACTNASGSCPASASLGSPAHYTLPDAAETACGDALDNDLDGFVNDGCAANGGAETGAQCANATDDDGDSSINDGCPVPALPIAQNVCRPGSRTCAQSCTPGNTFTACLNEVGPCTGPNCDGCNGLDDDCDNKIDENFQSADCSTNCGIGATVCVNGAIQCNSTAATGDATCDGIDDDCDNEFDEDWLCIDVVAPIANPPGTVPASCDPCGVRNQPGQPFNPLAICGGTQKCQNGDEICDGTPANPESCNCVDDDCDGVIDEDPDGTTDGDAVCGATGGICVSCQCAFGCAQGEFPCPLGKKCEVTQAGEFCVNDPCFNITCNPVNGNAQTCIPKPGFPNEPQCVDICSLVNDSDTTAYPPCSAGTVCVGSVGECRPDTCETFPDRCTANQTCVNGGCVTNPCQGVTCDGGQYCLGGECVSSCADVSCPSGQRCRQGACETDPCGKQCPFGQACNDSTGQCIEDPCKFRNCPQGQWCNPNLNACEDDPCVTSDITCPNAGEVCRGGTCLDPDSISVDAAGESHVTVGGGGGCNTSGGSGGLLLLLGALGLAVSRRRRTVGGAL